MGTANCYLCLGTRLKLCELKKRLNGRNLLWNFCQHFLTHIKIFIDRITWSCNSIIYNTLEFNVPEVNSTYFRTANIIAVKLGSLITFFCWWTFRLWQICRRWVWEHFTKSNDILITDFSFVFVTMTIRLW